MRKKSLYEDPGFKPEANLHQLELGGGGGGGGGNLLLGIDIYISLEM